MLHSRRGQLTVFIIVGILILFTFTAVLFFTRTLTRDPLAGEREPVIAAVPAEFQPLQSYTESCLSQTARQGLLLLGEQGGYIYPEMAGDYSSSDPTGADGVDLQPAKVPYWHYNLEDNAANSVRYSTLRPKLHKREDPSGSVESQLERFVAERIGDCLNGYEAFGTEGFEVSITSPATAYVSVADETVNFLLQLDVEASRGDASVRMEQFLVKIPLRLKQYYAVATQITDTERNHSFLERQALDLLATYAAVDPEQLPPQEAVRFDLVPAATWAASDVKSKVQGLLTSYVPMLRYLGSSNFYRHEYPGQLENWATVQKNYDNMIIPLEFSSGLGAEDGEGLGESLPGVPAAGVLVNFDYFGWEPYFDINDNGGVVEPVRDITINPHFAGVSFLGFRFSTQYYHTTYDLSYPVLVTIHDPAALNGRGYTFAFALESNIRNNAILEEDDLIPPPLSAPEENMLCDRGKHTTKLIRQVVVDSSSGELLEAVRIGMSIPEQADCTLGLTDSRGVFEGSYPPVYGGVGSLVKEGYLTGFYPINTYEYREEPGIFGYAVAGFAEPVLPLHKVKTIKVRVQKKNLEKCINDACPSQGLLGAPAGTSGGMPDNFLGGGAVMEYKPELLNSRHSWHFTNAARALADAETVTVTFTRVGDINPGMFSDDFGTVAFVSGNQPAEVELVPGVYEVTALLQRRESYIIPEEERCSDDVILGFGEQCTTLDETELGSMIAGQLDWTTPQTRLSITPEQLYGSEELVIYVPAANFQGIPQREHFRVLEDLQVVGQLGNYSRIFRQQLEPGYR